MDDLQYLSLPNTTAYNFIVLNLVINGWPSIQKQGAKQEALKHVVLNLVINGWPSIL